MSDPDLLEAIALLGAEERRVLHVLALRLLAGQRSYGKLVLARDHRDWRWERAAELRDALIYGAIGEVAVLVRRERS